MRQAAVCRCIYLDADAIELTSAFQDRPCIPGGGGEDREESDQVTVKADEEVDSMAQSFLCSTMYTSMHHDSITAELDL